jgi:hypothetical protein
MDKRPEARSTVLADLAPVATSARSQISDRRSYNFAPPRSTARSVLIPKCHRSEERISVRKVEVEPEQLMAMA